jgi:hypothetical protein
MEMNLCCLEEFRDSRRAAAVQHPCVGGLLYVGESESCLGFVLRVPVGVATSSLVVGLQLEVICTS